MTRTAWIGLGAMGGPMASVVARTQPLVAFDIDAAAVAAVAAHGAEPALSIAEAARGANVLAIMVATEAQVDAVLFGDDGAAAALTPGAVVLVMATVGPAPIARWAERLAALGVALVDAPVSGGVARAAAGDLLMMVSGAPESIAAVSGLLDALARDAPVVGNEPGEGQKVKLVNQLLCGIHIAAAGEALAFAEALGLDARACWEVIRRGAAASFMLDDRGERMLDAEFDVPKSAVDIFVKDLGLVVGAAERAGAWTPIAATAEELYVRAHDAGLGRKDDSVLIDVLRSGE
jgi:3-hydroxyisobutyrate dehydrogenase/putative dehydrogenase